MENLAVAAALVNTCNSQGWAHVQKLAEQIITAMERQAIDCEDESQTIPLARKAKGGREFWETLCNSINARKDPTSTSDNGWVDVTM